MLASCAAAPSSGEHFSSRDYGVAASPRLYAYGQRIPKGGGRYLVGDPYRVAGRTYVPTDNPDYSAVGYASWYGRSFHGRRTANGEVYDMDDLTAAHPTLPLPCYARVTNLYNHRSIIVRVNDRGPYARDRIIDVSSSVAEILDFKRAGVTRVKVDYVGPARLDGNDHKMLLASYRGPGSMDSDTLVAAAPPPQPDARLVYVKASVQRPRPATAADFGIANDPIVITPSYAPAATRDDPLAPLILRSGLASSYLASAALTPAQAAAARLATAGSAAASATRVIQVGVFSDPANAARNGALFARFGRVQTVTLPSSLVAVRVLVDNPAVATTAVMTAAGAAGLPDAFLVTR